MAFSQLPPLSDELLHELTIEYLKMKYTGGALVTPFFVKEYCEARLEILKEYQKYYSAFLDGKL